MMTRLPVSLMNGATNYGGTYAKAEQNIVTSETGTVTHLSGLVRGPLSTGSAIGRVEPSVAPTATQVFTVHSATGPQRVDVQADGFIVYRGDHNVSFLSLNGVTLSKINTAG